MKTKISVVSDFHYKEERPQGDSNPRCRRERPMSWARLDDRDTILGRARLELATLCLKGRYSTNLS